MYLKQLNYQNLCDKSKKLYSNGILPQAFRTFSLLEGQPNVLPWDGSLPTVLFEVQCMRFGTVGQSSGGGPSREMLEVFVL